MQTSNKDSHFTKKAIIQAIRYVIAGGLAFCADFGVMVLLKEIFNITPVTAGTVSFCIGLTITYTLSVVWIFDEHRLNSRLFEFLSFAAIGAIGLALTWVLMKISVDFYSLNYMISKIAVTAIVTIWNFMAKKYMLFTDNHEKKEQNK